MQDNITGLSYGCNDTAMVAADTSCGSVVGYIHTVNVITVASLNVELQRRIDAQKTNNKVVHELVSLQEWVNSLTTVTI